MKKLELRNEQEFLFAALIQSVTMNPPTVVDGVELQSCSIQYLVTRGTRFVTHAVGSEALQYGTNTSNVLLSSRNKTVEVPRYINGEQVFNGVNAVMDERALNFFVGKVCLLSGNVGYYGDQKSEIYKPVLKLRSATIYIKDEMKALVSKVVETRVLPSFSDEASALTLLKVAEEKKGATPKETPQKPLFELLGKSEQEWIALDKDVKNDLVAEYIKEKSVKSPNVKAALYAQIEA